ncbi:ethionine resistance protein [Linderina macrospora]|uniref:Ethionine resistance protein n=1 Tax=Linderina macrospora TaxID=4868 RepID=A0ACC1J6X5_9FUNG|nr:ethionine resistance protein [Linderina macrospora]
MALVKQEVRTIVTMSIPVILSYMLQFSFNFINILSIGHLGADELAAAALGNMTVFMLICAPAVGLASALDTFCSTAFTASKDKTLVGFHLQRGIIAVTAHFFLVLPIMLNLEPVLLALNQDPTITKLCSKFVLIQLFGLIPWVYFECIKRFLQAQGYMRSSTIVLLAVLPVHIVNNFLFVWSPSIGMGFLGAAAANVVTFWLMFIGIVIYTYRCDARYSWAGWSWKPFRTMPQYYKLAIPSVIMMCSDWLCWESMAIGASYLGNVTLAGQSIVLNTCTLMYQAPGGLSIALTNRVGNLLGQARARRSHVSSNVGLSLGALTGVLNSVFCLVTASWWGKIYSSDPDVVACVALIMPICAIFQIADAMNAVTGGALRGLGRQKIGACINFPSYYLIGLPAGVYLTYGAPDMGIVGLWIGMCISVIFAAIGQTYICVNADFDHEVERCMLQVSSYKDSAAARNQTGSLEDANDTLVGSTVTLTNSA